LVVVITLIGMMAAIALPELMPVLMLNKLEGASRHVAAYGRGAMSYAGMMRATLIVKFDLGKQEYWTEKMPDAFAGVSDSLFSDEEDAVKGSDSASRRNPLIASSSSKNSTRQKGTDQLLGLLGRSDTAGTPGGAPEDGVTTRDRFDQFARAQMVVRAKQVKREGILDEIGPLFEEEFSLDEKKSEDKPMEITESMLARTSLPEGISFASIRLGSSISSSGVVEVEVSPLGLYEPVTIYLKDEDDTFFTVVLDPITNNVHFAKGKKEIEGEFAAGLKK